MRLKIGELQKAAPGMACCTRCGIPLVFTEHHTTYYTESAGCFPLCQDCWEQLGTAEQRLPFYRQLVVDEWKDPAIWPAVAAAVRAEVAA